MKTADKITAAVGAAGVALVTGGIGMMHVPSGCIVAGLFALAWSFLYARAGARAGASSRRKGR